MTASPLAGAAEAIDWSEASRFLAAIHGGELPPRIVLAVFGDGRPAIHLAGDLGPEHRQETELALQRYPERSLGVILNRAADAVPADWGSNPSQRTKSGVVRCYGGSNADIRSAVALWSEADGGLSIEAQLSLPELAGLPAPSLTVATGGKSVHGYWLPADGEPPLTPAQFRQQQRAIAARIAAVAPDAGIDKSLCNPARVMRLPGSIHPRTGQRCEILTADGPRYRLAALLAIEPPPPEPRQPIHSPPLRAIPAPQGDGWFSALPPEPQRAAAVEMVGTLPLRDREGAGLYGDSLRALAALVHRFGPDDAAAICHEAGWEHPHHWRPADKVHELAAADHPERAEIGTLIHLARGAGWQYETSVAVKQASRRSSNRPLLRAVRGGAAADTGTPPAEGEPQLPQQTGRPRRYKLSPHDIRRELPNRLGKFRRNNRTGEIESENGRLPANQLSRLYVSLCSDTETWPKEATCDTLEVLADENAYDPVAEYLERITAAPLPMDQWERLDRHLLGIDDPIAAAFLPRYLMSAVARTIDPGCDVRQSPVLVGPQWRGKTALGRILFGPDAFVSGVEGLDRDAIQRCHTAWGVELAELDGVTRRSDKEKLKAFLTETTDTIQLKYDKHPAKFHRRFVFWGTANRAPLNDATGSTRFVVIMLPDRDLPLDWAAANRDAIWARALQQLRSGIEWWRTSEEEKRAVAERNAAATIADPWADAVAEILEAHQRRESGPITFPRILSDQRIDLPTAQHNKSHVERVRTIAESLGWQHGRRRSGGSQPRTGLWPPDPVEQQQQPDTPQAADMPPSSTAEDSPSPAPSAAPRLALSGNPPAIGTPAEICTAGQWRNGYRVEAVGTGYVRLVKPGGRPTEMRLETEGITWRRC